MNAPETKQMREKQKHKINDHIDHIRFGNQKNLLHEKRCNVHLTNKSDLNCSQQQQQNSKSTNNAPW